ncbi:uncharacterized protein METZ01_LOCUS250929 [marine metagenome]|uniref:Sodium/calcium exchanger membrane region domain-containing protein n=1 Tax=marine metagenome TaxID=408172 RepID=A0A382IFC4_9ZZZZ
MASVEFSDLLVVVGCLAGLVVAADRFLIVGAANLALRLRMSSVLVGVLIVGFGTSAPELVVSVVAILEDQAAGTELAIGNIVGSNVANLTLVLAIPALFWRGGVKFEKGTPPEARSSLVAVCLFGGALLLVHYGHIDASHGPHMWMTGVVLFLCGFLLLTVKKFRSEWGGEVPREVPGLFNAWTRTLVGLIGTVGFAHFLVSGATNIAHDLGWTSGFVGFTLIALGTSLPELVTVLAAARQGRTGLILGNLLGSNLLNSLGVGAVIFFIHGVERFEAPSELPVFTIYGMMAVSAVLLVFLRVISRDRIDSREAVILLLLYGLLLGQMVVSATG